MSETGYWEERERAKKAALKMAANLSVRDKGLVVTATRRGLANDVAHDKTKQRSFERGFLSLDHPDEDGNMWDYGDCGREMRKMLRSLDADYRERVRSLRFTTALDALDGHPALQDTLWAICRFRKRRRIAAALGIPVGIYAKRFTRICRMLGVTL